MKTAQKKKCKKTNSPYKWAVNDLSFTDTIVRTKVLTSLKELASLMSLKWIEPSILGFKQITLAKTNANDLK